MARRKAKPPEPKILEIDGIPTVDGLVAMGREYAYVTVKGIRVTDRGHAVMGEALKARARESVEKGQWHGVSGQHPGPPAQPGYRAVPRHEGPQRGRSES